MDLGMSDCLFVSSVSRAVWFWITCCNHIILVHQFSPKQSNILQLETKEQHQFNLSEKLIFGCSINQTRKQTTTQALGNLRQMCEPLEATKCSLEAHDIMQLKDLRMK